ncbi:MAG: glycosyltransferase family A protein [Pseudomonadota bacterium]
MSSPKFSILLPTRDRPATFKYALATIAAQAGDDFEIVVADNASGPAIKEAVDRIDSCPVIYTRSDEILTMVDNWERGLAMCNGEYVTVLGDDDGLMPSCLSIARRFIEQTSQKLLNWRCHSYWWPDTIVEFQRNKLYVSYTPDISGNIVSSRDVLKAFYKNQVGFGELPMIYNSFIHRDILEETKLRWGRFLPLPHVPDVASGILNLALTESYAVCQRPLAIRANSGKSNGTSFYARSKGKDVRENHFAEERAKLEEMLHPSLIPSPNLHVLLASVKLFCKELAFPEDPELQCDLQLVVNSMIATLNQDVPSYEENLSEARELATKYGLIISEAEIPPKAEEKTPTIRSGIADNADGKTKVLTIDGDVAGIRDVNAACMLAESIHPVAV